MVATFQDVPDRNWYGSRPDVLLTDVIPPGASGDYFDEVDRQLKSSIPAPRLPEMQGTTGGGG